MFEFSATSSTQSQLEVEYHKALADRSTVYFGSMGTLDVGSDCRGSVPGVAGSEVRL